MGTSSNKMTQKSGCQVLKRDVIIQPFGNNFPYNSHHVNDIMTLNTRSARAMLTHATPYYHRLPNRAVVGWASVVCFHPFHQLEFQDPKIEVHQYHIRPYFVGVFPYILGFCTLMRTQDPQFYWLNELSQMAAQESHLFHVGCCESFLTFIAKSSLNPMGIESMFWP